MGRSRGPTARTNKDEQMRTLSLISKKKNFLKKKFFDIRGDPYEVFWNFMIYSQKP